MTDDQLIVYDLQLLIQKISYKIIGRPGYENAHHECCNVTRVDLSLIDDFTEILASARRLVFLLCRSDISTDRVERLIKKIEQNEP